MSEMIDETVGHIALANARRTEEQHLATTNEQIAEWQLTVAEAETKIRTFKDGIDAQRTIIVDAKREQAKLKRKRLVFRRAAFALDLIEQE